jgi:hypothetical protein
VFSNDVPTYSIDLDLPESERWKHVIAATGATARQVVLEATKEFQDVPALLQRLVTRIFGCLYKRHGGLYTGEIAAWAQGLGVSDGAATVLNCAYELSHVHLPKIFGCTAGVRWVEGKGMVHVRTLDWPLTSMGGATCLFRFYRGKREFYAVGVPGHVGILSGMRPGGYSVTINWAPPASRDLPSFRDFGPAFLLRDVLESCDTYADALDVLQKTRLATSVFFTVCGTEPGEACVIERSPRVHQTRDLSSGASAVVQTNHHLAPRLVKNNAMVAQLEDAEFLADSGVRAQVMQKALEGHDTTCDIARVLDLPPVLNSDTVQKMVFCPRTGEVRVWRRVAPANA